MKKIAPVKKNDIINATITDLTYEGLGVAKVDGFPLFVENALVGEEVRIKVLKAGKNYGYAKVIKFVTESPERVEVKDVKLTQTGIAPLQHLAYPAQLAFKQTQVKNVMAKIAKMPDVKVEATLGMENPFEYRNKAQVPVRKIDDHLATGFFRKNSHDLVEIDNYHIQDEKIDEAIVTIRGILQHFFVTPYNEDDNTGFLRHLIVRRGHYSHQMMVVMVTRKGKFFDGKMIAEKIHDALPEVVSIVQNINPEKTNVILGKENVVLWGQAYYEDKLLGNKFEISAPSFYQINTTQAEVLYQKAIDFADLKPTDIVVDAYSGIGTISLSVAKKVEHVYGVEVVPVAVEDAQTNAQINKIDNTTFIVGPAEHVMAQWQEEGIKPNVVIVDPPRKGLAESFIDATVAMEPEKVVYVSCNPATLARDLALFADKGGYVVKEVQPVDLFPQTFHVECVALLEKA